MQVGTQLMRMMLVRLPLSCVGSLMLMMRASGLMLASLPAADADDAGPVASIQGEGPQLMLMLWATSAACTDAHDAGPRGAQLMLVMRATCLLLASRRATDAYDAGQFAGPRSQRPHEEQWLLEALSSWRKVHQEDPD